MNKPFVTPVRPMFSSGPCAKRPGWQVSDLDGALLGRSHRSGPGKEKLAEAIEKTRKILKIPADYRIGIVPASDTGAVEMALWSLLGQRGVDVFAWESFGRGWVTDIVKQLGLEDVRLFEADYGSLPDMYKADASRDCVFTWNGTTSGVVVPSGDWIASDREGLTICDATSAVFAYDLPWDRLDVTTYSWQKVLGGEAAHGMLILSPRAVERLESYTPPWPMPKIFRMTKGGKLIEGIFKGATINTPSMLAVEDYLDALYWSESVGGLDGLIDRTRANFEALDAWVSTSDWAFYLAEDERIRSRTSVCLKLGGPRIDALDDATRAALPKKIASLLEKEGAAFDIAGYRDAPAGLRIWCGATVEAADIAALCPWLDWALETVLSPATV